MDESTELPEASSRLRMNLDLRNSLEDGSQRMLNAIEPGSPMPIHRHRKSSETVACLRGRLIEEFYDDIKRTCTDAIELSPNVPNVAINIPIGQWYTMRVLESGTVIMDLHQSLEDKCHRMINAVESGTGSIATPIEAQKSGANPSDEARTHRQNRINILDAAAIKGWLLTESN